jgi:uncharacterized membrane protein
MFGPEHLSRSARAAPGTNLVPIPFAIAGIAIIVLAITLTVDALLGSRIEARYFWLSIGNLDDARAILGAILGAVSTVLALIFSVTLLVFSTAVNQFGPRLMPYFMRDRTMQVTLGLFLATFLYSLATFIVTGQRGDTVFVPQLTLLTCVALVFTSFFYLVVYNNRVAQAIQTNNVLARIIDALNQAISELAHQRHHEARAAAMATATEDIDAVRQHCVKEGGEVLANESGFLQKIDYHRLVRALDRQKAVTVLAFEPGQFILEGEVLAHVAPITAREAVEGAIHSAVAIGPHRTLEQDIDFAFAQLSEIAIRALSPAINDTYTGLYCIDWLGDGLRMLTTFPETDGTWRNSSGTIRVLRPPPHISSIIHTAFDLIREAGARSPAVAARLLQTYARLAPQLRTEEQRCAISDEVEAVWQAASHMPNVGFDRAAIDAAYRLACDRLTAPTQGRPERVAAS